jgi:hypothetical protein
VLAAAVGGSNIYEQMRAFDEERADELVRVYREHNEPLTTTSSPSRASNACSID